MFIYMYVHIYIHAPRPNACLAQVTKGSGNGIATIKDALEQAPTPNPTRPSPNACLAQVTREREFFIDNTLVRVHRID